MHCRTIGFRIDRRHEQGHQARSPRSWQNHPRPRGAGAQPQERRSRDPARRADRVHGAVGVGQVLARLRHDLRGRAAPLRGEPVGLRAPVPGDDAEARRRPHRWAVAGHLHRAEDDFQEPALHRRHGDGDLRLPAPAVRPRRRALFAGHRPADREPDRDADGGSRAGTAGGHAALPAGAHRARAQGRVPQGAGRAAEEGLPAGQGQRCLLRDRRRAQARQEIQARHRRGGGSPGPAEGGRRESAQGHRHPARRQLRDGVGPGRRHCDCGVCGPAAERGFSLSPYFTGRGSG